MSRQHSAAPWDALVLTCQNRNNAHAFQRELELHQQKGLIHKDVLILTVEDPTQRVGSGGATVNALLLVAEYLCAKAGFPLVNSNVFLNVRIVVMHMGRDFPYDACGRTFTTLPQMAPPELGHEGLMSNIDALLQTLEKKITVGSPPGVWVCSTDMLLDVPVSPDIQWTDDIDVLSLSVPISSLDIACQHGVYKINDEGYIANTVYKGSPETLRQYARFDGKYNLVLGVVYFSPRVADILTSFHAIPPLNGCTYYGLDSGAPSIEFSIFFDLLAPMYTETEEKDFVHMLHKYLRTTSGGCRVESLDTFTQTTIYNARAVLWRNLNRLKVKAVSLEGAAFNYLSLSASDYMRFILAKHSPGDGPRLNLPAVIEDVSIDLSSVVMNSMLGAGSSVGRQSIISHCSLPARTSVGSECLVSGVRVLQSDVSVQLDKIHIHDGIVLQGFNMFLGHLKTTTNVFTLSGKFDNLQLPVSDPGATFCNKPWSDFFEQTGITSADIWDSDKVSDMCLLNAKLFPVLHATYPVGLPDVLWLQSHNASLETLARWRSSWRLSIRDILGQCDLTTEFSQRRELFFKIGEVRIKDTLLNMKGRGLMPFYRSTVVEGYSDQLLTVLDKVIIKCSDPGIAARTMGNIADVLECMSKGKGGLRSGPALNKEWKSAFSLLKNKDIRTGVEALTVARSNWLSRPDHLIRAARHYEGAGQIFIKQAVDTATKFIKPAGGSPLPAVNKWVVGKAPARIDIAGGWSDTPPMTYEHGGAVVNAAVLVNGKKPIGAKARRIPDLKVVLVLISEHSKDSVIELNTLKDMEDYCCPQAPGALLKAALIAAKLINVSSNQTLEQQLTSKLGSGLEVHSWANLPHGSGLGTSSILAGVTMAVLWTLSGASHSETDLIHAVLHVEQLLTTGGGWQDQVGGLAPGIKMGHCTAGLPVEVKIDKFNVQPEVMDAFNRRIVLLYTGKTRLAKNLLQNAVRAWYGRDPEIVDTMDNLVYCAEECRAAFMTGDLEKVGKQFSKYWQLKKRMAVGSEPAAVTRVISLLQPYIMAACMAGAGGGGFLYLFTKESNMQSRLAELLKDSKDAEGMVLYDAEVDLEGLKITVEEDSS